MPKHSSEPPSVQPRLFRVGTFYQPRDRVKFSAYLRDYNAGWLGCIEYTITAASGEEAKAAAIAKRKAHEAEHS